MAEILYGCCVQTALTNEQPPHCANCDAPRTDVSAFRKAENDSRISAWSGSSRSKSAHIASRSSVKFSIEIVWRGIIFRHSSGKSVYSGRFGCTFWCVCAGAARIRLGAKAGHACTGRAPILATGRACSTVAVTRRDGPSHRARAVPGPFRVGGRLGPGQRARVRLAWGWQIREAPAQIALSGRAYPTRKIPPSVRLPPGRVGACSNGKLNAAGPRGPRRYSTPPASSLGIENRRPHCAT